MSAPQKLYEGKAKIVYTTDDPEILLAYFKDDATAFNAQKRGTIQGKGEINNTISTHLFKLLEAEGVPTHFIDTVAPNEMRVKRVKIVPIEVIVRNIAAGSLCKQTGIAVGTVLEPTLVEYCYKNDELGDPLLTGDRLFLLKLATPEQLDEIKTLSLKINQVLSEFFDQCGITLVDFKLEFGYTSEGQLVLADEISPDTCRLWNKGETDPNLRVMDKDRFRHDLGNVESAYQQVLERVLAQTKMS
ncbi:phosphoribosylaminoimidazolesuccinocarboxamide synthase [Limnoraphis robusta]|uniref:phosphoribosylaminoimidazolesuccinocarboxamide synthase n=1 Tax=Limnoraphis robusta TaxID=1118279 RepID=UPI002B1EC1C9|nr:phosphoribosylaminoimidazolesuccinocarboxamide synthase [Limnoraphis robusta]MEA5500744.1 phosphoribosylaminoimidazolesuccinocarboxamide synthase [Limnoraphis robusta BA-68 BA1]